MVLDYEVRNRAELVAAVQAASQPTYEEARANPVIIRNGTMRLTFKEGIQEDRGLRLITEINRQPKKAFAVNDQLPL